MAGFHCTRVESELPVDPADLLLHTPMRRPSGFDSFLPLLAAALLHGAALAQEPAENKPAETPPAAEQNPEAPKPAEPPQQRPRRQPRAAQPVVVVKAGHVHPVAGPTIQNGAVVIRGERILAVGPADAVQVPENAKVIEFADGHVYPGLVDALTDAFLDAGQRGDGSTDAGSELRVVIQPRGDVEDNLAAAGITTAYVGSRSAAQWRGVGALVRPTENGYKSFPDKDKAGLQLRLTMGPVPSHPIQRLQLAEGAGQAFVGLDGYEKTFTDHAKALETYQKDYEAYLEHFRKQKPPEAKPETKAPEGGEKQAAPAAPAQGTPPATPPAGEGNGQGRTGGRRRGGDGGGGGGGGGTAAELAFQDPPPAPQPAQQPAPAPAQGPATGGEPAKEAPKPQAKAPEKPKYPAPPAKDPVKENLLAVTKGKLPLRIEAHRADEIRSALAMAKTRELPPVVLECAYGAAPIARELADAGATIVLTDVLPGEMPQLYEEFDVPALPAALAREGVAFAIASGSARRGRWLPMMAALAVGHGLDEATAIRSITLTPAEILGVAKETGSLERGKLGDLLVTDKPLLTSDAKVLHVLSAGTTVWEAK